MKKPIFYPKLSNPDFHLFRTPGAGLGNLLFPWARAHLYAKECNGYVINPTWRNFKVGPILRREKDFRTYGNIFLHRSLEEFFKELYLKLYFLKKSVNESEFLMNRNYDFVIVEGMKDYFKDLGDNGLYLRNQLDLITINPPERLSNSIAIHIRMGDFSENIEEKYSRNSRVPLQWFINEAYKLREILGNLQIVIFTDDNTGLVKEAFKQVENIVFASKATAVQDILKISSAKHIVCSNSTFSLWSVFLSNATFSAKFPELFEDYKFSKKLIKDRFIHG